MNIKDVIEFLAQSYTLGRKFRLENIRALLRELGDPQRRLKVIHVAGTNGKGSVCAALYYMILEAGYSAGFSLLLICIVISRDIVITGNRFRRVISAS